MNIFVDYISIFKSGIYIIDGGLDKFKINFKIFNSYIFMLMCI